MWPLLRCPPRVVAATDERSREVNLKYRVLFPPRCPSSSVGVHVVAQIRHRRGAR